MADLQEIFEEADSHYYNSQFEEAIELYSNAIEQEPTSSLAYESRGLCWYSLNETDKSFEDFSKAIETDKENHNAFFNRGMIKLERKDFDSAISDFETALDIYGESFDYLGYLLQAGLLAKDYTVVDKYADRLLDIAPRAALAMMAKADSYLHKKDYKAALKVYLEMLEEDQTNGSIHNNIGFTLMKAEEYKVAISYFNKAIELTNDLAYPYNHRGWCQHMLGESEQGLIDIRQAIQMDEAYSGAYKNEGMVLKSLNQNNDAVHSLNKALELGYINIEGEDIESLINQLSD